MEEDFTDLPKQEVSNIQCWDEQIPEDLQDTVIQVKVNQIYQRYSRPPPPYGQYLKYKP